MSCINHPLRLVLVHGSTISDAIASRCTAHCLGVVDEIHPYVLSRWLSPVVPGRLTAIDRSGVMASLSMFYPRLPIRIKHWTMEDSECTVTELLDVRLWARTWRTQDPQGTAVRA